MKCEFSALHQVRDRLPHVKALVQYSSEPVDPQQRDQGVISWEEFMNIGKVCCLCVEGSVVSLFLLSFSLTLSPSLSPLSLSIYLSLSFYSLYLSLSLSHPHYKKKKLSHFS